MAKEDLQLFEDSSYEALLVLFHKVCDLFLKIHRSLKWWIFKFSLYGVARLTPSLAEDWFESHNTAILCTHLAFTWLLIIYRMRRRIYQEEDRLDGGKDSENKKNLIKDKYLKRRTSDDTMTDITEDSGFSAQKFEDYSSEADEVVDKNDHFKNTKAQNRPGSSNVIKQIQLSKMAAEDTFTIENTLRKKHILSKTTNENEADLSPEEDNPENHRLAVYAEGFNPEDDDNSIVPPVYKKDSDMRKKLVMAVKDILLFRSLDSDQLSLVVDAMRLIEVGKGEIVIHQGDHGDYFYVVESGVFEAGILSENGKWEVVKRYEGSGSFGELGLMYDQPRAATVRCLTGGKLWALDRRSFRKLVLKAAFMKRKLYESFISSVPILRQLTEYERQQVVDALTPKTFPKGTIVVRQGEEADGMHFIVEGEAKVIREMESGHIEKMTLGKGDYFGELALINRMPRAATVIAHSHLKTAFLDVMAFERLLGPCMDLMKRNIERYS